MTQSSDPCPTPRAGHCSNGFALMVRRPVVSKHLGILKQVGLVSGRQSGRQTHYAAHVEALAPLVDWTQRMSRFWDVKLDGIEDLLKRMDQ